MIFTCGARGDIFQPAQPRQLQPEVLFRCGGRIANDIAYIQDARGWVISCLVARVRPLARVTTWHQQQLSTRVFDQQPRLIHTVIV